jgi:hypothetical protein
MRVQCLKLTGAVLAGGTVNFGIGAHRTVRTGGALGGCFSSGAGGAVALDLASSRGYRFASGALGAGLGLGCGECSDGAVRAVRPRGVRGPGRAGGAVAGARGGSAEEGQGEERRRGAEPWRP